MTTYRVVTAAAVSDKDCPSCTVYEGPTWGAAELLFYKLDNLRCLYVAVWASDQRDPALQTRRKSAMQLARRYRADSHEGALRMGPKV